MPHLSSSRHSLSTGWLVAGLAAALFASACQAPQSADTPAAAVGRATLRQLQYGGSQAAVVAIDRAIAAAGQDSLKLAPIAAELGAVLRDPAASAAGRQAAAERLAAFPAELLLAGDNRAALLAMLQDEQQVNLARLALDRAPGDAIDAIFLEALQTARGASRLALVQSAGNRRIAGSVPVLTRLAHEQDPALAPAAIKALGQIATPEALAALRGPELADAATVAEAQLAAADRLGGAEALAVFQQIAQAPGTPAPLRAAAIRALLFADPASAPQRAMAVLAGNDAIAKAVVVEAVTTAPGETLVPALAASLAQWAPATQQAVLAALGRRADPRAVPAAAQATSSENPGVRLAAIEALGRLPGTPESAVLLAQLVSGANADQTKQARESLSRLTGPGVTETVIAGCREGEPALRAVFLEQIAARGMADQLPLLLEMRNDPSPVVRSASLSALADIAPPSAQAALLAWTMAASDSGEQNRAIRALAAVTLRNPDVAGRATPIITALEQAPTATVAKLLPVLQRIGGEAAADCAARIALREDPTQASAAVTTLARWSDDSGLLPLVRVSEQARTPDVRAAAAEGAFRQLDRARTLPSAQLGALAARVLATTTDGAQRNRLVYLLGRTSDPASRALVERLKSDPALAATANDALLAITANQIGAPKARASDNAGNADKVFDRDRRTRWAAPTIAGQWIQLDLRATRPVKRLVLESNEYDYPEQLDVYVTDDPAHRGAPVASTPGQPRRTVVELAAPARGRYLILENSHTRDGSWWSIAELSID